MRSHTHVHTRSRLIWIDVTVTFTLIDFAVVEHVAHVAFAFVYGCARLYVGGFYVTPLRFHATYTRSYPVPGLLAFTLRCVVTAFQFTGCLVVYYAFTVALVYAATGLHTRLPLLYTPDYAVTFAVVVTGLVTRLPDFTFPPRSGLRGYRRLRLFAFVAHGLRLRYVALLRCHVCSYTRVRFTVSGSFCGLPLRIYALHTFTFTGCGYAHTLLIPVGYGSRLRLGLRCCVAFTHV